MGNTIFTATGCARCNITKRFMKENAITYEEYDFKGDGKEAFSKFYRANRANIFRDRDGVEFPVFTDGEVIRQGVSVIIGHLIAGDALSGFIGRSRLHGEWIDGFDISSGDPSRCDDLVSVLKHLKQNGLKIQLTTNGRNADVLQAVIDHNLADRVLVEVKGPAEIYGALAEPPLDEEELKRSIALAASCPEVRFHTVIVPVKREDGTMRYLSPEEIGRTAQIVEAATGSKKHNYTLSRFDPATSDDPQLKEIEPLEASAMFKYRTAARRFMVMTEIEK